MICFPNAKINLGLNILEKRSDGYHTIETVFYPVQWCDALEVVEDRIQRTEDGTGKFKEDIKFSASGLSIEDEMKNNLCFRAYQLLKKDFQLPPLKMHLHKIIPMGAGLGGGSADAAFTLKLLNELFHLKLKKGALKNYAAQIGSDCSFFLENVPAIAGGKGELLEKINLSLKGFFILIVRPEVHVSTADAYRMIVPQQPERSLKEIIKLPVYEWSRNFGMKNDFEKYVFEKFPAVSEIKNNMYQQGAVFASMTGSGSAV